MTREGDRRHLAVSFRGGQALVSRDGGRLERAVMLSAKAHYTEVGMNKRKKVALRKHRVRRKKLEEKRKLGQLARGGARR